MKSKFESEKRILVTGGSGQLGQEFKNNVSKSDHEFYFTDENELDIVNKNHIFILDNLTSGNYKIRVYSEDSSGNGNFSEYKELNIEKIDDSAVNSDEDSSTNDASEESILDVLFSPRNQIIVLSFMILFVVSLFRAYPGGRND